MRNRVPWMLSAGLAGMVLLGGSLLLKPYWIAKYRGRHANLQSALLPYAPLAEADLNRAFLTRANLSGANLYYADLRGANLQGAILVRAHLSGARLAGAT